MTHKIRHKQLSTIKKKYKNLAGIVAAATLLSTATLPGLPTTIAHASASPHSSNMSASTSQHMGKTNDSGMQINFNESVVAPTKDSKAPQPRSNAPQSPASTSKIAGQANPNAQPDPNLNKAPTSSTKATKQANPNAQPDPNLNKTPVTTTKGTKQANPNAQPDPNLNKAPVTTTKGTKQANPNAQPDPNLNKAPVTTTKGTEQANPNAQPDPNLNKAPVTATKGTEQANPNAQPDPNLNKAPVTATKGTEQANPNAQPDPNLNKAPVTATRGAEQANLNSQPDPNVSKTSSGNAPTNYKHVLDIKATAYAPGPHDNDQYGSKTYIGSQVRPGIIAVDPKVIPLGSRVYIEYPDGHGEYAVAEDTGGAIKGNRVDIAKWTVNEAKDFGIQNVKVYVVKTPEKT